jgi:hypothetical protein
MDANSKLLADVMAKFHVTAEDLYSYESKAKEYLDDDDMIEMRIPWPVLEPAYMLNNSGIYPPEDFIWDILSLGLQAYVFHFHFSALGLATSGEAPSVESDKNKMLQTLSAWMKLKKSG